MDFNQDGTKLAIGAFSEGSAATGVGGLMDSDIVNNNGAGAAYVFDRADKIAHGRKLFSLSQNVSR